MTKLDADLGERDGEKHAFYHRFNNISTLNHILVLFMDEKPVRCGALKAFDSKAMGVKRMYTLPEARDNSLATKILKGLELWVTELGNQKCILETGKR